MSELKNIPELLAPAGSMESLRAAIDAGCDAVYFGLEQLNMRARSSNSFTTDKLKEIMQVTSESKVKAYLTLNTILYDHDIRLMKAIVDTAIEHKVDGIIAADPAVINYASRKGISVHISTQANITNIDTVEYFSTFADVMVLARELTLKQVKDISREIKRRSIKGPSGNLVKLEIFAHGALCMAVSGKCYLSLHTDYASANRGACVQNCRRSYIVKDKETETEFEISNEYIMSAKDLCTIDIMDLMVDSGIDVIKIEGRGRAPEYVYTVTKCYREALDSIRDDSYSEEKVMAWRTKLETVFNRGFWNGYYLGKRTGEWSNRYGSAATKQKVYIGKGRSYYAKAMAGEFLLESGKLGIGDDVIITGPTTGLIQTTVRDLHINGAAATDAKKGDMITILLEQQIRPSDKLYKVIDVK